jgi:hypothetical protein
MLNSGQNVRFQVLVNGKVRGTAGMQSLGVLSLVLDWVRRDLAAIPKQARKNPDFSEADWICNKVHVHLGGLDSVANQHVVWFGDELSVGDEVTVRLLPAGEFDRPRHRQGAREGG